MSDAVKKYFSPRLLDYFVFVGARQPSANHSVHIPELLRRYPPDDHKDFPLPPDVVFFCQPEGCISLGPRRMSPRETNSFVFALTEKDTSRVRYGICVNFYRPMDRSTSSTAGSIKGSKNTEDDQCLGVVDGKDTDCQKHGPSERSASEPDVGKDKDETKPISKSSKKASKHQSNYTNSLTSLCIISHHPFFSTFRECLFILKKIIEVSSERNQIKKSPGSRHGKK